MANTAGIRTIDPLSDRPVYKQIADILRQQIDAGDLAPGAKLPSESELTKQFETGRSTVRNALDVLASEGRTRSARGVGVFVREQTVPIVLRQRPDRLARRHHEQGRGPLDVDAQEIGLSVHRVAKDESEVSTPDRTSAEPAIQQVALDLAEVPAPVDVAEYLGIPAGATVFARRRMVRLPDDTPLQLADSYLPLAIAQGRIREVDSGPGGIYARIEEHGHRLTRFTEQLRFRMPSPDECQSLRLDAGVPIINLIRIAYAGDMAVECFVSVMAGDKHRFEYRIDADGGPA